MNKSISIFKPLLTFTERTHPIIISFLPGGDDIQAQANLVLDQDAIRNADGNIKATAEVIIIPSKPNSSDKELSYHVFGYFLQIQLDSGLLTSVCGLLKYLLLGPLFLAQYLVVFLMWLLDCGKDEVFASLPFIQKTTKICLEKVDDGKRKLVEAVQLLIHSGGMTMLLRSTWLGLAGRAGRPSCRSTPRGTGSMPSATRGRRP